MSKLAITGGRFSRSRVVVVGSILATFAVSILADGPHSAVADELSSGLPYPQSKPTVTSIEQKPFFEMASLNLRTLAGETGLFGGDGDAGGMSFGQFGINAAEPTDDDRPFFSLANLNLRTFAAPERDVAPIHVISDGDAKRYRHIFELQQAARWDDADLLINALHDRILMGHVLYQRYMHPTGYRSSYQELRDWLEQYADLPDARTIYRLARLRQPAGAAPPPAPRTGRGVTGAMESYGFVPRHYRSSRIRTETQQQRVEDLKADIEEQSTKGSPSEALRTLLMPANQSLLDRNERDLLRTDIAAGFFYRADYQRAIDIATISSHSDLPQTDRAHWILGLAYWKLGQPAKAVAHFEQVAKSKGLSPWKQAAGAFWAARCHERLGHRKQMTRWLRTGSEYPGTFYGMLNADKLGEPARFHWRTPALDERQMEVLRQHPAAIRGLALIQVGRPAMAAQEFKSIDPRRNKPLQQALVAVAEDAALPDLAVRVGSAFRAPNGQRFDTALYPIPPWSPEQGFEVDRALVFGFMRQESRFNPLAESGVGATGLMQLMPTTARYMGRDDGLFDGSDRSQLLDPSVNIELGQRYLAYLLRNGMVRDDLLLLAAAYNAGPGNLQSWRRRVDYKADPLFFIESIPIKETRDFVERVLSNFWIYRLRFNQPTPSLEALASGQRPLYARQDSQLIQVAARDRH